MTISRSCQIARCLGVYSMWFVDADVAAVVELSSVQVPPLDETLGQHQDRAREFCVWNWRAFALNHCTTNIAHLGSAQQANRRFALNPKYEYNV